MLTLYLFFIFFYFFIFFFISIFFTLYFLSSFLKTKHRHDETKYKKPFFYYYYFFFYAFWQSNITLRPVWLYFLKLIFKNYFSFFNLITSLRKYDQIDSFSFCFKKLVKIPHTCSLKIIFYFTLFVKIVSK